MWPPIPRPGPPSRGAVCPPNATRCNCRRHLWQTRCSRPASALRGASHAVPATLRLQPSPRLAAGVSPRHKRRRCGGRCAVCESSILDMFRDARGSAVVSPGPDGMTNPCAFEGFIFRSGFQQDGGSLRLDVLHQLGILATASDSQGGVLCWQLKPNGACEAALAFPRHCFSEPER